MKSYKPKKRHEISYETLENLPTQIANEATEQFKLNGKEFWAQLLGSKGFPDSQTDEQVSQLQKVEKINEEKSNDEQEGVIFTSSKHKKSEHSSVTKYTEKIKLQKTEIQPGIDYHKQYYESIAKSDENASRSEAGEENKQIQQIITELKKLVSSTKALQVEFGQVTIETTPDSGKYYINFFEWLLIMIKQSRQKVEDSKSWLGTVHGKNKKMDYWGKSKKLGTTFTQANERYVATSTG